MKHLKWMFSFYVSYIQEIFAFLQPKTLLI